MLLWLLQYNANLPRLKSEYLCKIHFVNNFDQNKKIHSKTRAASESKIDIPSFLKISFWDQAKMPKQKAKSNKDVYEKVEDLPEVRQKNYFSILEDFDKQGM